MTEDETFIVIKYDLPPDIDYHFLRTLSDDFLVEYKYLEYGSIGLIWTHRLPERKLLIKDLIKWESNHNGRNLYRSKV